MAKSRSALEFKGRMLSLTWVRIFDADPAAIEAQLKQFTRSLGEAARGLPVVVDADVALDLKPVLMAMMAAGVQPIAAMEGALADTARACGLPVLPADVVSDTAVRVASQAQVQASSEPASGGAAPAKERRATRIVTDPIRSGQQLYAENADLVIMTTVSPGAEVIADGCIHVYGPLRGRAIAGAHGDMEARVFCRRMEADLLAVAGIYAVADQMHGDLRGKPAQAYLSDGKLKIEKLDW